MDDNKTLETLTNLEKRISLPETTICPKCNSNNLETIIKINNEIKYFIYHCSECGFGYTIH